MKKTTFLIAASLFMTTISISQNTIIQRFIGNGIALSSAEGPAGGYYAADQFELTEETTLGTLEIFGVPSNFPAISNLIVGFNVFVYEDVNGLPAGDPTLPDTGIIELGSINPSNFTIDETGENQTNFIINLEAANGGELTLGAGTYWLVASPVASIGVVNSTSARWSWSPSNSNLPDVSPLFNDPNDLFGLGVTEWESPETANGFAGSIVQALAWTLYDGVVLLSTEDNVIEGLSVSPNPTNGVVNFNLAGGAQLNNISVYDISGRQVISNNNVNTVDLTNYSRGVYVARLTTANGLTQSARIVKQ